MPSPFPGMDPYLEGEDLFPSLHGSLITYLQELLQPRLPEPYFAKTNARVWVEMTRRYVEPDVDVFVGATVRSVPGQGAAAPWSRPGVCSRWW